MASAKVLHDMGLRVTRVCLPATVRQARDSSILYNATWLLKGDAAATAAGAATSCKVRFPMSGCRGPTTLENVYPSYAERGYLTRY